MLLYKKFYILERKKRIINTLKLSEKLAFSSTAIGKNLVYFLVATYYMFYLTQVQGLSGTVVGIFFGFTRVFDAINDPLMGTIVDNTRSKFGKFRPWIMAGTVLNAIVLVLMFTSLADTGIILKYVFYLMLYVLWGITYTLMDVPYWSMIPAIATCGKDKDSVSALTQLAAGIGTIAIIGGMPFIFELYGTSLDERAYFIPSIIIGIVFIILTAITVVFVKEKTFFVYKKVKLKDLYALLINNDQLIAYVLIMMSMLTASTLLTTFATYFFSFALEDYTLKLFGIFTIVAGVSQAGAILAYPGFARKYNKIKMFFIAAIGSIFGLALMFILTLTGLATNVFLLSITGIITLFGFGWIMVISVVMLADIVDYGEKQNGNRTESIIFSMKTLVQKFAAALASAIIGIAIDIANISGKDPKLFQMTLSASITLRVVMFLLPSLFILTGMFFYKTKYSLGNSKTKD